MNDRETIGGFIQKRIRQSSGWLHVKNKQLREWIKEECESRRYNSEIVEEILNRLLP